MVYCFVKAYYFQNLILMPLTLCHSLAEAVTDEAHSVATSRAHPSMPSQQGKFLGLDKLQPCLGKKKTKAAKQDGIGNKKLTSLGFMTISICIYMVIN